MSASQDKRKRNPGGSGFGTGGGSKSKESNKAKVTARALVITIIAVAVLFVVAKFINSDYIRQNFAAVKIDGIKYTVVDFNYYYQNTYAQYYNAMQSGGFGEAMLPNMNESLKSQIYDEETGETWADFIRGIALDQMKADNMIYKEALDTGFQLSDEDKEKMESEIENLKMSGLYSGANDFDKYLKSIYGKAMTEEIYRRNAERSYIIASYTEHVRDSFQYSDEELEAYYTENNDNLDTYTYRYFLVSAGSFQSADYPDEEALEAAKGAAVAATVAKAEEYAARITDEQSFIDIAREYDPEANNEDSATKRVYQGELLGSVYGPWMKDATRKNGDITTVESSNGCYVVYFIDRSDNHYPTVNMRQIIVAPETIDKTLYEDEPNDDAYNKAVDDAKQVAKETAEKISKEWMDAGATEEKLTELKTTYAGQISADNSTELKNVYKQQLSEGISNWLFDPARKAGDNTILYDEATGYHIISYTGQDMSYSDFLSDTRQRDKDLEAWKAALTGSEPETTWLMTMTA